VRINRRVDLIDLAPRFWLAVDYGKYQYCNSRVAGPPQWHTHVGLRGASAD